MSMELKKRTFKLTIDDGESAFRYDIVLNESWDIDDIKQVLSEGLDNWEWQTSPISEGVPINRDYLNK